METNLEKLIDAGSEAIGPNISLVDSGSVFNQLIQHILNQKNGFYAFENALLVRPLHTNGMVLGVNEWNAPETWKNNFNLNLSDHIFFAENIFGEQFSLSEDGVFLFDPELGELKQIANNLEIWAQEILADSDYLTGYLLAHDWQLEHGKLPLGSRLLPRQPFVLQGSFSTDNLVMKPDVEGMKIRAQLADKIANMSDGTTLYFEITE